MSMCRWIVDTTADVDVKLLASCRSPSDVIFRKELKLVSARHSRFHVAVSITSGWRSTESWTAFTGRISKQMIEIFAPDYKERHMCGPEPFSEGVKELLRQILTYHICTPKVSAPAGWLVS
jgi:ferredoxin-NADP reductase